MLEWEVEQLERLCSEDNPPHLHTTYSAPWHLTPDAPWWLILLIHIGSQVKTRQSQGYRFIEFAKRHYLYFKTILQATHLLKWMDQMCKYEMDPASLDDDTERTRFCPQTDGQGETNIPLLHLMIQGYYNDRAVLVLFLRYPRGNEYVTTQATTFASKPWIINHGLGR